MFKSRRCCCCETSGGGIGIIAVLAAAAAAYLIIHAIWRVLVEIAEIAAVTVAGLAALALMAVVIVAVARWRQHRSIRAVRRPVIVTPSPAPVVSSREARALNAPASDPEAVRLFAEAIAHGADRRIINAILRNALDNYGGQQR